MDNSKFHLGTVSCDTMRTEDLIPAFTSELLRLDPTNEVANLIWATYGEYDETNSDDYFESENARYDLDDLFDELNKICEEIPFVYFGASEGDGADYGFWIDFYSLQDAIRDEEVIHWIGEDGLESDLPDDTLVAWSNKEENDWALYQIKDGELHDMIWSV